jgi:hypothetical protein
MGDVREGEDPKSPSYAEILKKNPRPSPPLTRGRKENINRKEKDPELETQGAPNKLWVTSHIAMG